MNSVWFHDEIIENSDEETAQVPLWSDCNYGTIAQYFLIWSSLTVIIQITVMISNYKYHKNYKSCGFMTVKTVSNRVGKFQH